MLIEKRRSNKIKTLGANMVFNTVGYAFVSFVSLCALLPVIMIITGSLSSEQAIARNGFSIYIQDFSLYAYEVIFNIPEQILRAYGVSIFVTAVGTFTGLFIISMVSYALSRKDLKYRNTISFFFYFTTLFNGGLVAVYIFMIRYLHMKNNILALILPMLVNVFYVLIMRSFMSSIPVSIIESAKIDGASELRIFFKLILPLSSASLATIGLFIALEYWNDWYNAMLYIDNSKLFPLQYKLYDMISSSDAISKMSQVANIDLSRFPSQTMKLAMAVVATGPIVLVYPFVQRYFVKGITIGSVKG